MSLYQKYRPTSFAEVIGNKKMIEELQGLLSNGNTPHAFLFIGPTGCGKTTIGRLTAAALGAVGEDFDERDSADFRGIDTIRQIRHNAYYRALHGERRAWLIDECHKLTNDAQNALLKGLEDPPPHCYYMLATTEKDRVLNTVKSRCSVHIVEALTIPEMMRLLSKVSAGEGISVARNVLRAVALKSSPNAAFEEDEKIVCYPRHALNILEKVLVVPPDDRLQTVDTSDELIEAENLAIGLLRKQWKVCCRVLSGMTDDDVEGSRRGVMNYCAKMLRNGGRNDIAAKIIFALHEPLFNSGLAGYTTICYHLCYDLA